MAAAGDTSAQDWFRKFTNEKGAPPTSTAQLDTYIRNRGGRARYSEIRAVFQAPVVQESVIVGSCATVTGTLTSTTTSSDERATTMKPITSQFTTVGNRDAIVVDKGSWIRQVNTCLISDAVSVFSLLPEDAKADVDVVSAVMKRAPNAMAHVAASLRADREFMLSMMKLSGTRLQFASDDLKSDRGIVLEAVKQSGDALKYAAEVFWSDKEVVLTAMRSYKGGYSSWSPVNLAAGSLRGDLDFFMEAVELDPGIMRILPAEMRDHHQFMRAMVAQNASWLQFGSDAVKADRDIVLLAVEQDPFTLRWAASSLKQDVTLVFCGNA